MEDYKIMLIDMCSHQQQIHCTKTGTKWWRIESIWNWTNENSKPPGKRTVQTKERYKTTRAKSYFTYKIYIYIYIYISLKELRSPFLLGWLNSRMQVSPIRARDLHSIKWRNQETKTQTHLRDLLNTWGKACIIFGAQEPHKQHNF